MVDSLRQQDMRAEHELGKFMDEYLYSCLTSNSGTPIEFYRSNDVDSQLSGVDVVIRAE